MVSVPAFVASGIRRRSVGFLAFGIMTETTANWCIIGIGTQIVDEITSGSVINISI